MKFFHYFSIRLRLIPKNRYLMGIMQNKNNLTFDDLYSDEFPSSDSETSTESIDEICQECNEKTSFKCINCNGFCCEKCFERIHLNTSKLLQNHILIKVKNITKSLNVECDRHDASMTKFCFNCQQLICEFCIIAHKKHEIESLKSMVSLLKSN